MEFDQKGYLMPYEIIESDLVTLQNVFVEDLPASATRRNIFDQYTQYLDRLRGLLPGGFVQWVDGSFVSQKLNPADIDIVTFVDYNLYQQHERTLDQLRRERFNKSSLVDGYFVAVYPEQHSKHGLYRMDRHSWYFRFGTSRDFEHKGLIQLTI